MLRSVYRQLDPNVSGKLIGPILRFKHLENGAYRLSRNIGKYQYTLRNSIEVRRSQK